MAGQLNGPRCWRYFARSDLELGCDGCCVVLGHARSAPSHQLCHAQRGDHDEFERSHPGRPPDHCAPAVIPKTRAAEMPTTTAANNTTGTPRGASIVDCADKLMDMRPSQRSALVRARAREASELKKADLTSIRYSTVRTGP